MKSATSLGLLVVLALVTGDLSGQSAVYRSVDEKGNVTFSDKPSPGARKVPVQPVQTYQSLPNAAEIMRRGVDQEAPEVVVYTVFGIVSPEHDASVRSNAGDITVGLTLEPELRDSDQIQILLDGKPAGEPSRNTILTLSNINRGTHTLEATIVDSSGQEISRTDPVTFHLLRVSRLLPPPSTPPPPPAAN